MAFRRKRTFKKWRRKKRNFSRKSKVGRPSKALTQSRYFFKRKCTNLVTLSAADGTTTGGEWSQVPADLGSPGAVVRWGIKLSDLPDNSEFSSGLFSHYRINAFKVKMIPQFNTTAFSNSVIPTPTQVIVYTMPYNYSDYVTTSPLTESKCLQTQACKTSSLIQANGNGQSFYSKARVMRVAPKAIDSTVLGGLAYYMAKPHWIPCAETDIVHYGLIQRFQPNYTSWPANMQVKLLITAYIEFKGVV